MSARSARVVVYQAAGRSAPLFLTSILSLTGALDALRLPTGAAPVRVGFVILALVIGIGLTVAMDRPGPRPYWQMTLLVTIILMPVVALQASASRVPFVAISRGSAGPLLWLTLASCITLFGLWLFAAHQSDQSPENASLLFLPAAVLVPAMLVLPVRSTRRPHCQCWARPAWWRVSGSSQRCAPANWRPMAGAIALGTQFVVLWMVGRGPVIGHDSGTVVPASAALLLALTTLLIVLTPLGALFSRRFVQTIEEEAAVRGRREPPRGALAGLRAARKILLPARSGEAGDVPVTIERRQGRIPLVVFLLGNGHGGDHLIWVELHQGHTLRLPSDRRDLGHRQADDLARRAHQHHCGHRPPFRRRRFGQYAR